MTSRSILNLYLHSLSHPINLACIILLLFNDHVLKIYYTSYITGKLSDFTGLFFFPFLLAVVLCIPLVRIGCRSSTIRTISFTITLVFFALIKTSVAANLLIGKALTALVGPVQIVKDPSDLMALVVLWPAWLLWKRLEKSGTPSNIDRLHFLPLGLAALATAATSCPPLPDVYRLVVDNDVVYANVGYESVTSIDGVNWEETWGQEIPANVLEELQQQVQLPLTLCLPEDQNICYRITGQEQVEESLDSGQTWGVAWKIPFGRRYFMDRVNWGPCSHPVDPGPFDMVVIGSQRSRVLFASGSEGVLIRNEDGSFSRHEVLGATPTPYAKFDLFLIPGEILAVFTLSLLVVLLSSFMAWNILLDHAGQDSGSLAISKWSIWLAIGANVLIPAVSYLYLRQTINGMALLFGILIVVSIITLWNLTLRRCFEEEAKSLKPWLVLFPVVAVMIGISLVDHLTKGEIDISWLVFLLNIFVFLVTMMSLTWAYFKRGYELQVARRMQIISWQAGGLCLILSFLPFALWMIGWIPLYEWAIGIAGVAIILILIGSRNKLERSQKVV
jgi:hypothetical protein